MHDYYSDDELLASQTLSTYDLAYPVYWYKWEIRRVQNLNKLYTRIFYKKLDNTAKAIEIKINFLSVFSDKISENTIIINDIDKLSYNFFKIIAVPENTRAITFAVTRIIYTDGCVKSDLPPQKFEYEFSQFENNEISNIARNSIQSAKGYPVAFEDKNLWICCCGAVNKVSTTNCIACNESKEKVFKEIVNFKILSNTEKAIAAQKDKEKRERMVSAKLAEHYVAQMAIKEKHQKIRAKIIAAIIAAVLICAICLGCAPLNTVTSKNITFHKYYSGYSCNEYNGNDYIVKIPSKVRGVTVCMISGWSFSQCDSITTVYIPDSIEYIGANAFEWCDSLTKVIFEDPYGWSIESYKDKKYLDNDELENKYLAATYLTDEYSGYKWVKYSSKP